MNRELDWGSLRVAVLVPCYNEETTISQVIRDFAAVFPDAEIFVYDNNSTDNTVNNALAAGAIVRNERLQGKGHVVRRMFADIDADVYVIVDGDNTYNAAAALPMVRAIARRDLDFVNGRRVSRPEAYRRGHRFGNWLLTALTGTIFGARVTDMLSGLKVLSARFVKSFPCLAKGFEIETEITVHALELKMPIDEMPVEYRERGANSSSKLNTVQDGIRIVWLIFRLLQTERPGFFFGIIFVLLALTSSFLGWQLFVEWRSTGLVFRIPTAVLTTGMMLLAFLSAVCGIILETVTLGRRENKRMVYLSIPRETLSRTANGGPAR